MSRSRSKRSAEGQVRRAIDEYKDDPPNLLPASATTPPVHFFYASSPTSTQTHIDSNSIEYGPAIIFMLATLRHIAHTESTLVSYSSRLKELIAVDSDTRSAWKKSVFSHGEICPSYTQIQDYILARQRDGAPPVAPLSIVIAKLRGGNKSIWGVVDKKLVANELYVSEDLIKVFVQTQRGLHNHFHVGPTKYEDIKRCTRHLLLVTVFRELGHALTQYFFGVGYVSPIVNSVPSSGSFGEFGYAIEISALGGICVIEWIGDAFQTAQTDEERLWRMNRLLCKVPHMNRWKYVAVEPEQLDVLADSLLRHGLFMLVIPKESKSITEKDTTRANYDHGVLLKAELIVEKPSNQLGMGLGFDPFHDFQEVPKCCVEYLDEDGNECSRYA